MARRNVMTALQAALAGIGGAASGYVQQEERKRRQRGEDEEREMRRAAQAAGLRAEERDLLRMGATEIAKSGEMVAGPVPSAVPMMAPGLAAIQAAEQQGGPATSAGRMRQTLGERTFALPGLAESRAQALAAALEQAAAERGVAQQFKTEDTVKAERSAFNALKKRGLVKGEFDPEYGQYGADLEDARITRRTMATRAPGGEGGDRIQRLVESTIAKMVLEGKPGLAGSRTAYTGEELKTAAQQIRDAAGGREEAAPAVDRSKAGTDTTGIGGSPKKPRLAITTAPPITPTPVVPTAPAPTVSAKPVITRQEYDALIAEGQDSRRILERYEVRGR